MTSPQPLDIDRRGGHPRPRRSSGVLVSGSIQRWGSSSRAGCGMPAPRPEPAMLKSDVDRISERSRPDQTLRLSQVAHEHVAALSMHMVLPHRRAGSTSPGLAQRAAVDGVEAELVVRPGNELDSFGWSLETASASRSGAPAGRASLNRLGAWMSQAVPREWRWKGCACAGTLVLGIALPRGAGSMCAWARLVSCWTAVPLVVPRG